MHERSGQIDAALHPAGEPTHRIVRAGRQAHDLEKLVDARMQRFAREPINAAKEAQVLARAESRIERDLLGHEAQPRARAPCVLCQLDAAHTHEALVGREP